MAISYVSSVAEFSVTTVTVAVTSGDLIVVQMRSAGSNFVTSVADTVGTTYRRAIQANNLAVFYGVAAGTNASNVITPTWTGGPGSKGIAAATFNASTGWDTNPLHRMDFAVDAALTSPGMTTTIADALIVGCCQRDGTGSAWSAGSGFTEAVEDASNVQQIEYQVVSAIQTNVAFSATNAGGGDVMFFAFVEDQGGGGGGGDAIFSRIRTGF